MESAPVTPTHDTYSQKSMSQMSTSSSSDWRSARAVEVKNKRRPAAKLKPSRLFSGASPRRGTDDAFDQISPLDTMSSPAVHPDILGADLLDDDDAEDQAPVSPLPRQQSTQRRPVASSPREGPAVATITSPSIQHYRLVIAIDFGTTFTGVAFSTPDTNRAQLKDIELMNNYGPKMGNHDKIPSVISYSAPSSEGEKQWGVSLSPDAVIMINMKLELDVQDSKEDELQSIIRALDGMHDLDYKHVHESRGRPAYSPRGPETVVTDYLRKVFGAFSEHLDRKYQTTRVREETPVDIVITVPVVWSYEARNATFRAVKSAGFNESSFLRLNQITMLKEPEAAALYVVRYLKDDRNEAFLKPGSTFVLCDAGGGTVDVIAYKVIAIQPKLQLKPIGKSRCAKSGAIYIDLNFKYWLRKMLGQRYWQCLDPKTTRGDISPYVSESWQLRFVMQHFDGFKRTFGKTTQEIQFRLPEPLQDITVGGVVKGGLLTISQEAMKSFFEPCIITTLDLIRDQIMEAELEQVRVKNVIIVGGFAASHYLQDRIQESLRFNEAELRKPDTSWTAIVRGAVIAGVENVEDHPFLTGCEKNYGIALNEDLSAIKSSAANRPLAARFGRGSSSRQCHWLIRKGDLMVPGEERIAVKEFKFLFTNTEKRIETLRIFEYQDDDAPKDYERAANELDTALSLTVDFTKVHREELLQVERSSEICYEASVQCVMRLLAHKLKVEIIFNNKTIATGRKDVGSPMDPVSYGQETPRSYERGESSH